MRRSEKNTEHPMKIAALIAKRWAFSSPLPHTRNILRMGMASMGLCVAVMVISTCILVGFKREVSNKVFGFGSHVVIQPYWNESGDESLFLRWDSALQRKIMSYPQVASAQAYALKGALIKGRDESHGVFFKGLPPHYDTLFFYQKLKRGHMPVFRDARSDTGNRVSGTKASNRILISEFLARKLELDTGSKLRAFFVHDGQLRPRSFSIAGIYSTGLEKFDATYILCDIAQIQALNGWDAQQADGIDIRLKNPDERFETARILGMDLDYGYSPFPCDMLFPEIFDWLALIDTNVLVLIIIMMIVCMICLTSLLFILIIERKPHIGILKTLGASNALIRHIFIRQTLTILGRAMLFGNAISLIICLLQKSIGFLRLDESIYFLDRVPVDFPWISILTINTLIVSVAAILLYFLSFFLNRTAPTELGRS